MPPIKILIMNPNTNQSMTSALRAPIESLDYNNTTYTYHTAPSGPASINSLTDAHLSTPQTLTSLLPLLPNHDAFLIACYSPHPLVRALQSHLPPTKPVIGIFEASVHAAVQLLREGERFGIISTGDVWKGVLEDAVRGDVLGGEKAGRVFMGVETCGVDAGELHGEGGVEGRVRAAAGRLVGAEGRDGDGDGDGDGRVGVVVLGCAGMVGMEGWVRDVVGREVRVVDGVRAGVGVLQGLVRGGF